METGTIKPTRKLSKRADAPCDLSEKEVRKLFEVSDAAFGFLEGSRARLGVSYESIADKIDELFATSAPEWNGRPLYWCVTPGSVRCPAEDAQITHGCYGIPQLLQVAVVNPAKVGRFEQLNNERRLHAGRLAGEDIALVFADLDSHVVRAHKLLQPDLPLDKVVEYLGLNPST